MAQYTRYPDALDNSDSLPLSTDSVTEVKAEVVNRIREALIAVEAELGTQPSGTYGTTRARLDALEAGVGGISSTVGTLGLSGVLGVSNTTSGLSIIVSSGDTVRNESGTTSLSDFLYSPALVLTEQASRPGSLASGKGTIWVRNDNTPIYTDDLGVDHDLLTGAEVTAPSVAVLRTMTGLSNQAVTLAGYATANDGGGGEFIWSNTAATDDGGTIFNAGGFGSSSAGWRRIYSGALDVTWFGADSTGATSSVTAITQAISAATTGLGNATVWFPRGAYTVASASLPISLSSNVTLDGEGPGASSITVTGSSTNNLFLGTNVSNITICRLKFYGNSQGTSGDQGRAVSIVKAGTTTQRNIRIEGCHFENFKGDYWLNFENTNATGNLEDVWVENNRFVSLTGNSQSPTLITGGTFCIGGRGNTSGVTGLLKNVYIQGNFAECNFIKGFAILYNNLKNLFILDNEVANAGQDSVFIDDVGCYAITSYNSSVSAADPDGVIIRGNRITAPRDCGMYIAGADNIEISDNYVSGQTSSADATLPKGAVALNAPTHAVVSGNVLIDNRFGISAATLPDDESYITLSDNIIRASTNDAHGIVVAPYTGGPLVGNVEVSNNLIRCTGTLTRAIFIRGKSTEALASLRIINNNLYATYACIQQYSSDASSPNIGFLDVSENKFAGAQTYPARLISMATTKIRIHENDFFDGWNGSAVQVLDISGSLYVDVRNNVFRNFLTGTGFCLNTTLARGVLIGNTFQNVANARRFVTSGSEELGVDTPTWTTEASSGMFVQDLNPTETVTVYGSYVRSGWVYNGSAWLEQSTLASSPITITAIKTSVYTAAFGDLVRCDPSSGGFTINLPTAIGNTNKSIMVKNVTNSINTITIDASGGQTIDDSLTYPMSIAYQSITLVSDGSNWILV